MANQLIQIKETLLAILFPPLCAYCNTYVSKSHVILCDACAARVSQETALICPVCEARLAINRRICNHAQIDTIQFPYLLGAATRYEDPLIRTMIHRCKYEKVHAITEWCANILTTYVDTLTPEPTIMHKNPIVVPIPLHPRKERERGFNQSALIAESFAKKKGFQYDELLVKVRYDDPQAKTKSHAERMKRMQGVFALPEPRSVHGRNIILIDDVSTSGATLSEAAQTLKKAGAKQILALVFAKA